MFGMDIESEGGKCDLAVDVKIKRSVEPRGRGKPSWERGCSVETGDADMLSDSTDVSV